MNDGKIGVLVVEDSTVTRMFLVHLLESDPGIRVVGAVGDGVAALEFVGRSRPDVILMDIHMPRMDGFEATRRIMETRAVPIVICSATTDVGETAIMFRALEAGAIACIEKPFARDSGDFETRAAHMLQTVKLMSEVRVVRRTARSGRDGDHGPAPPEAAPPADRRHRPPVRLIGIGASTGGPPVLQTILASLPRDFPVPVLVVQHIAAGFVAGMAAWLGETSGMRIHLASYGTLPLPGHVYLAPDDFHMGVGPGGRILLTREPPENHVRPAVSFLFRTLAQTCGAEAVGVLLTGMGRDGAQELKAMRDAGAVTIAQDRDSSVVHGMPGAAIELKAAGQVLPADRIAAALVALVQRKDNRS